MASVDLPRYRKCFVCGVDNPCGLRTRPRLEDNEVVIEFTPEERHCGFKSWLHGGITASLLDEAMFWAAAVGLQRMVATAELSVRYLKPVPIGTKLRAVAQLVKCRGVLAWTRASLLDGNGTEFAAATGRYAAIQRSDQSLAQFFPDDSEMSGADLQQFRIEPEESRPSSQRR